MKHTETSHLYDMVILGGGPAGFTAALYEGDQELYGPGPAAYRMKELWYYLIHLFDGGEKIARKMCRVSQPWEYETLRAEIFQTLPLRREPAGSLE